MSIKIFSFKGFDVVVTVLSVAIPVGTWIYEKFWKKDCETLSCDSGAYREKKSLGKVS